MEAKIKNAIIKDLELLKENNLSLEMLKNELKDDPEAYEYSIDDLEIYLSEEE